MKLTPESLPETHFAARTNHFEYIFRFLPNLQFSHGKQDCCKRAKALFLTFPGQPHVAFAQLAASPILAGQPHFAFAQLAASPILAGQPHVAFAQLAASPIRAFSAVLGWDCFTSKRVPSTSIPESHHSSRSPLGEVG